MFKFLIQKNCLFTRNPSDNEIKKCLTKLQPNQSITYWVTAWTVFENTIRFSDLPTVSDSKCI